MSLLRAHTAWGMSLAGCEEWTYWDYVHCLWQGVSMSISGSG
ncbi:hypothetical protein [Arthrobacter methylotrophus]